MNILITGANGYIGQRLIPVLLEEKHTLYCCVRNKKRFDDEHKHENIYTIEIDFLQPSEKDELPVNIAAAYYLIHSMNTSGSHFEKEESATARRFLELIEKTSCKQVIYLSGIVNEKELSEHLSSRLNVENILNEGKIPVTVLRAGIIVGSGSASFEIMRDLIEKLPVMVTPRWLNTKCQPIAIRNVIQFLAGVLMKEETFKHNYDIGGREILTYKQMLLQFAKVRKLKRWIFTLPVMTPRLSSYWLYFITSTSYSLAVHLVNSMKINVVCRKNNLAETLGIELLTYTKAVQLAFEKIEQRMVLSSWKDAFSASHSRIDFMKYVEVPVFGCFKDLKWREVPHDTEKVMANIWSIGGEKGWYYGNALWKVRGLLDKAFGGVGLRRGRTHSDKIHAGDALDFWRVLIADKENRRLLLFAEMKLPGEAWLEFKIMQHKGKLSLRQTATFRPKGLWGRLYWYSVLPFHYFIFNGMINNLVK
ncbi:MAG: SDR family oxidoreductase [Chitinophagaceae bacterium]